VRPVPNSEEGGHTERAVYRPDVALSLEWGRDVTTHFTEEWVTRFADPEGAYSSNVELRYGGEVIYRWVLVQVDGGRTAMPMPLTAAGPEVDPESYSAAVLIDRVSGTEHGAYSVGQGMVTAGLNAPG
jgi:hypothetical protein